MIIVKNEYSARLTAIECFTDFEVKSVTIEKSKNGKWLVKKELFTDKEMIENEDS